MGPLIPLFWTSGDVSSGFQSQSGFCLIRTWWRRTSNITCSLRFTSGATPARPLCWPAWLPSRFLPHACKGIGGSRTGDLLLHERTLNRLSYAGSALYLVFNDCYLLNLLINVLSILCMFVRKRQSIFLLSSQSATSGHKNLIINSVSTTSGSRGAFNFSVFF